MPTKPLNLRPISSGFQEKAIQETTSEDSKNSTSKTKKYGDLNHVEDLPKKNPNKKNDSKSLAKNFAQRKTDALAVETPVLFEKQYSYTTQAELKKTGSAKYLDPSSFESTAIKPIVRPGSVFTGEFKELMIDVLESRKEMEHTLKTKDLQSGFGHLDIGADKKKI